MNIVEALKIAKEQGRKVRPVGCTSQYIVYEDGVFLVKMSKMSCEHKLEIYSHAIEYLIFEEWEDATTEADKRIIERKRKAIKQYCHNLKAGCEECYISKICDEYQKKRDVFDEFDDSHRVENWSFKDVNEAYQILIEKKVKFECL